MKKKLAALTLVAAVSAAVIAPLNLYEGNETAAYPDSAGVYTICRGVTFIPGVGKVQKGMRLTEAECDDLNKAVTSGFIYGVAELIKVPISIQSMVAHVTFAYNIGLYGYKTSYALKYTNQGRYEAGCAAMRNWHRSGGMDCRIRSNNCYGLITRRENEVRECLAGS